jgi:hypothetical protein
MSAALTYVYCLVRAARPPKLPRVVGLPELGGLRRVDGGDDTWLVVADAPAHRFESSAIQERLTDLDWVSRCAVAHEAVVASFLRAGTVIPFKLFTIFKSDERAVADVRRRRRSLQRIALRIADCEEWGVRVQTNVARLGKASPRAKKARASSGTAFLHGKRAAQLAAREELVRARTEVEGVFVTLAGLAADTRRHRAKTPELAAASLLEAAFLVPRGRAKRFFAALDRATARLSRGPVDIDVSGPWPPYNFVGGR